jgi:hypothetical protein
VTTAGVVYGGDSISGAATTASTPAASSDQRGERDAGGRMIPFSTAHAASCVRVVKPCFAKALAT